MFLHASPAHALFLSHDSKMAEVQGKDNGKFSIHITVKTALAYLPDGNWWLNNPQFIICNVI